MALAPGTVFAGFTIEGTLGVGGMGTVYLARHPRLPRSDALKLLRHELSHDPDFAVRFAREADIAARLSHPNIVGVNDRGTEGGQLWISMPFVDGMDAEQALQECDGPMPPERAVRIVGEVAAALDFAHGQGMWHRDVKPANILLTRGSNDEPERVLLTDFGIAKAADDGGGLTKTGNVVASFDYAPPEQIEGRTVDHRVDIYALGCVLYKLLTGSVPFPGVSMAAALHGHLNLPAPRPTSKVPGLAPGLDDVVARAMAKDPDDRFPSCRALAIAAQTAIRAVPDSAGSPAPPLPPYSGRPYSIGPRPAPAPVPGRGLETAPRSPRYNPPPTQVPVSVPFRPASGNRDNTQWRLLAALLAAVLLVGAGITVVLLTKDSPGGGAASNGSAQAAGPSDAGISESGSGGQSAPAFTGPLVQITPNELTADSTAGPSMDDQGNPTYFDAVNMIDGLPETAWRTAGDASGQHIVFSFSRPVHLTSLGLIPGYAKTDPLTGVDRFLENRRLSRVRWTTAEGLSYDQDLADDRSLQSIDVDTVTSMVTLTIVATLAPGNSDRDYTPISEVSFAGQES